jgi:hypothetical protein
VNIPLGSVRVDWLHRRDFEFRFRRSLAPGGVGREKQKASQTDKNTRSSPAFNPP